MVPIRSRNQRKYICHHFGLFFFSMSLKVHVSAWTIFLNQLFCYHFTPDLRETCSQCRNEYLFLVAFINFFSQGPKKINQDVCSILLSPHMGVLLQIPFPVTHHEILPSELLQCLRILLYPLSSHLPKRGCHHSFSINNPNLPTQLRIFKSKDTFYAGCLLCMTEWYSSASAVLFSTNPLFLGDSLFFLLTVPLLVV